MCTGKQALIACGTLVVAMLVAGAWGHSTTPSPARAQGNAVELLPQVIEAINSGDADAAAPLVTPDVVTETMAGCSPEVCIGLEANRNVVEYFIAGGTRMTVISRGSASSMSPEGQVTSSEWCLVEMEQPDMSSALGMDRIIVRFEAEHRGDKISKLKVTPDVSDPQTAEFARLAVSNYVEVPLGAGRDADQSPGNAMLVGFGDKTHVFVTIPPGPDAVPQPANIHEGSCADLGPVAFSLQDVRGGKSLSIVDVSLGDLRAGHFAVNVQKSRVESDLFVACGVAPVSEVPPGPAVAVVTREERSATPPVSEVLPAVATAAPPGALPVAGSGGLIVDDAHGVPAWWYGLITGGVLLAAGGWAGLLRTRRPGKP